jgi:hypothetical protein
LPSLVHLASDAPQQPAAYFALLQIIDDVLPERFLPILHHFQLSADRAHRLVTEIEQVGVEEG